MRILTLLFAAYVTLVFSFNYPNTILFVTAIVGAIAGFVIGSWWLALVGAVLGPVVLLLALAYWLLLPLPSTAS